MQRSWAIFNGHLPGISFLPIVSTMSGLSKCLNRNRGRERRAKWRLRSYLAGVQSGSQFRCGTLSTPDPFFHFLCAFLPSGLSLDLTDSIIPSQAWILGSGAPRVAVSGPAVHLVATVHLLICTSLWAVCCVRAGPGWPTPPPPPGLQLLEPGAERGLAQPVLCVCERPAPSTPLAPLGRVPAAWVAGHRQSQPFCLLHCCWANLNESRFQLRVKTGSLCQELS